MVPPLVRVSYARLDQAGAYLLENGQSLYLWLGRDISPQFLNSVFGVSTVSEVDPHLVRTNDGDTIVSLSTISFSLHPTLTPSSPLGFCVKQRHLPEINSQTSVQLRAIVDSVQAQRSRYLNLILVCQGREVYELDFANQLVEDANNDAMSYVDYLCAIHRMIQTAVTSRTHDHPVGLWTSR